MVETNKAIDETSLKSFVKALTKIKKKAICFAIELKNFASSSL